ncbi:uncharacterized protein LOC143251140 isoform X2 [Tachypleus tridentatus]|uniref:uncharacterized protein LOC143251140 isoform X2 n=1 Tax=Tachypleus tridentatus TaxID=6853 RepID=UPI003FD61071
MSSIKEEKDFVVDVTEESISDMSLAEDLKSGTQNVLKYVSLLTLTVQNAALGLTMRMARTQKRLVHCQHGCGCF